jgi:hypothetical protein
VTRPSRRGECRLGSDERIAVAVAAHPVAKADRYRCAQRFTGRRELLLECAHERVTRPRARVEQPCLEIPEACAHLVEDGGSILPHFRRQPEQLDLTIERRLDRWPIGRRRALSLQQQISDARLEGEQRAPGRLGRMCGEHGSHIQPHDSVEDLVG